METISYVLKGRIPHSEGTGIDFTRIEMLRHQRSPLALVWYSKPGGEKERGARIDIQKQAFLRDFDDLNPALFDAEAQLIVDYIYGMALAASLSISPVLRPARADEFPPRAALQDPSGL